MRKDSIAVGVLIIRQLFLSSEMGTFNNCVCLNCSNRILAFIRYFTPSSFQSSFYFFLVFF